MWDKIKSVYADTSNVQRAFLWFAFGLVVAATFAIPLVVASIVAVGLGVTTIVMVIDFFYRICNE